MHHIHSSNPRHLAELIAAADLMLNTFIQAREGGERTRGCKKVGLGSKNRGQCQRVGVVWGLPKMWTLKINVDSAIFKDVGVGLGVIIRDYEGKVIRFACQQVRQ